MRTLMLIAALALGSCGDNQATNQAAVERGSGVEQVTAVNDITAIDAATGEAANMAADVDYTFNDLELNESAANEAANAGADNSL